MANIFIVIPVPVGNGSGAAVDVSGFGSPKTIEVKADTSERFPIVLIEISNDAGGVHWSTAAKFVTPGVQTIAVAARWMRCTIKKALSGVIAISMGAEAQTVEFATLVAPADNGTGVSVNTSTLPGFKTIQVVNSFPGACNIEISNDAEASYQTIASFRVGEMQVWSGVVFAQHMRVMRSGLRPGQPGTPLPLVNIATVNGSGSSGGGIALENAGVPLAGGPFSLLNLLGTLSAANAGGGQANVTATAPAIFVWHAGQTWDAVYALMNAVSGPKICLVEFDPASGSRSMTARAGDPTDLNQVIFIGNSMPALQDGDGITIVVEDGFKLADINTALGKQCSVQSQWLSWDFQALTSPAYTVPNPATDRAIWVQMGGQLWGSNAAGPPPPGVFNGFCAVSLMNVVYNFGTFVAVTSEASTLDATALSSFFWPIFQSGDGGGHALSITTDATCEWAPSGFVADNFAIVGSVTVNNYARGPDGNSLYAISVDGGGNVVATLVP